MQIVIDIPETLAGACSWHKNGQCDLINIEVDMLAEAIVNGTPLPKGCGMWVEKRPGVYKCSECGAERYFGMTVNKPTPMEQEYFYCPNCGAKMGGDTDGTDS